MATRYSSNNSGGSWWLSDDDWKALEAAGWIVDWYANDTERAAWYADGRFIGALASSATRPDLSEEDAIAEWEQLTGQNADDEGCECCGAPHYFYTVDEPDFIVGEIVVEAIEAPGGSA